MVTEDESGGDGKCAVQQFALRVHIAKDVEHCNVVCKVRDHTGSTSSVHAKSGTNFCEAFAKRVRDKFDHRISTGQGDGDLSADEKTTFQWRTTVIIDHGIKEREADAGVVLEDSDSGDGGDEDRDAVTKSIESRDHLCRSKPKTNRDQAGDDDNRDYVDKDRADADLVRGGVHDETTNNAADRDGDHTNKGTGAKERSVKRVDDAKSDRDCEDDGRAHHASEDDTGILTNLSGLSKLEGERVAAHIAGKQGGGEHGRVSADKAIDRSNDRFQNHGEQRSNGDDAGHSHGQTAHCVNSVFPFSAVTVFVSTNSVDGAHDHEDSHDHDDDRIDGEVVYPTAKRLGKDLRIPGSN